MSSRGAVDKPKTPLKATAVRMLARREYGRAELAKRLEARGATRAEVALVLDELERLGYLSDTRFAQALVTQKTGRYGRRAIANSLRQRQVAPEAAKAALDGLTGVDELAEATALWQRRFGAVPKDERERARHVRFLLARGYPVSIALKVLRQAREPVPVDGDDDAPV